MIKTPFKTSIPGVNVHVHVHVYMHMYSTCMYRTEVYMYMYTCMYTCMHTCSTIDQLVNGGIALHWQHLFKDMFIVGCFYYIHVQVEAHL